MSIFSEKDQQVADGSSNWGQGRRLEFIDFRLRWEKTFNRSDLTEHFGISVPQASLDIAKYLQLAPDNLVYDRSSRIYRATESYTPVLGDTSPHRYLNELLARDRGLLREHDSYIGWMPPLAEVPVLTRLIDSRTLSLLLDAIRYRRCVDITYQSDSDALPVRRSVSPHAFGHDGMRWHVRAYCLLRSAYRDFVIGRILQIFPDPTEGRDPELDIEWSNMLPMVLAANPNLSEANRRATEIDFSMVDGSTILEVREALLYYVLKQLRIELFAPSEGPPQQLTLRNSADLKPYIEKMKKAREPYL